MRHLTPLLTGIVGIVIGAAVATAAQGARPAAGGYIIEQDAQVAANEPGPHNGGGQTIGHSFFRTAPGLKLVFRKRVLKPRAAIGYHEQREDEIYYVLSGRGQMTLEQLLLLAPTHDAIHIEQMTRILMEKRAG